MSVIGPRLLPFEGIVQARSADIAAAPSVAGVRSARQSPMVRSNSPILSFWRALAGLDGQISAALRSYFTAVFSASVLRCLGVAAAARFSISVSIPLKK